MNREAFHKLLDIYKSRFESFNQPGGRHEIFKWSAVQTCQDNWNLDADDFKTMFKDAMSNTSFIIENSRMHPVNGIVYLCENGKTEEVRTEFRNLLKDDDGNLKDRQKRIESFRDKINDMLMELDSKKWSFRESNRDPIMFLSFIKPEENYMFKSDCTSSFVKYMDFGGDIGSGQTFHLNEYYRLCDEISNEISDDEELIRLVDEELTREAETYHFDTDKFVNSTWKLKVLVYDIIYVANTTDFYDSFPVLKKKYSSAAQKERNIKIRIEEIQSILEDKSNELEELKSKMPSLPELTGVELSNLKSGKGKVVSQDRHYIMVEFPKETREFALPDCLVKGFLIGVDDDTLELCKQISELNIRKNLLKNEISRYCTELGLLI